MNLDWPAIFQPEVETILPDPAETLAKLKSQIERVYDASPFYRDQFDAAGFHPSQLKSLGDIRHAPLVTKDLIRDSQQADPPLGRHAVSDIAAVNRLHLTSGTTGRPVFVGLTARDSEINSLVGARAFWAAGIRPHHIVLHCVNYAFYAGGIADHLCVERTGAAVVPVGIGQSKRLLGLIQDIKPTAIFAITSYPFYLAEVADEIGINPHSAGLRCMVVGGEPGGSLPETQAQIKALWGADTVSDTYGLSELISTFAAECPEKGGQHLLAADALLTEVLDPATNEPVPFEEDAEGVLTFTHLLKESTPMIRYRTGDMARITAMECACGRAGIKFRVMGRADDMFIVRGVNVFPGGIEMVVRREVPATSGEFCIVLESDVPKPPIQIVVEAAIPDQGEAWQSLSVRLEAQIRETLQFTARVLLVPQGKLSSREHKTPRLFRLHRGEKSPVDLSK